MEGSLEDRLEGKGRKEGKKFVWKEGRNGKEGRKETRKGGIM